MNTKKYEREQRSSQKEWVNSSLVHVSRRTKRRRRVSYANRSSHPNMANQFKWTQNSEVDKVSPGVLCPANKFSLVFNETRICLSRAKLKVLALICSFIFYKSQPSKSIEILVIKFLTVGKIDRMIENQNVNHFPYMNNHPLGNKCYRE